MSVGIEYPWCSLSRVRSGCEYFRCLDLCACQNNSSQPSLPVHSEKAPILGISGTSRVGGGFPAKIASLDAEIRKNAKPDIQCIHSL